MTKDEIVDVLSDLMHSLPVDDKRADRTQALAVAMCAVKDDRLKVYSLEEWISIFDDEGAGELSQMEQLEIKSMLIELKWYRDKAGVGNG